MGIRYVKRISDGRVFQAQEEEFFPLAKAQEVALKQGGVIGDYEIGVDTEENVNQWIYEQAESAKTYADKRKAEYDQLNQFEMQFDDDRDSTTTWVDKINEIKGRHPK